MSSSNRVLVVTIFYRSRPVTSLQASDSRYLAQLHQDPTAALSFITETITPGLRTSMPQFYPITIRRNMFLSPTVVRLNYTLSGQPENFNLLPHQFTGLERVISCEIIVDFLPYSLTLRPITFQTPCPRFKLAVFDMDSTLIDQEVIDELARSIGLVSAVSAITTRAMNGEIDFSQSLIERVALLKGVRADVWDSLKTDGSITIAKGAQELISGLKAMGVKTAVVSGGFLPMASWLKEQLGLDYAFANHLLVAPPTEEVPYEHLSGFLDLEKGIVDAEEKRRVLLRLAKEEGVDVGQTIAVGDGSNDLLMMRAAGLGVAWRAKAKVQERAPGRLNGESLEELLYLFGGDGE